MARTFTLAQLATRVRERADCENSDFISDTELYSFISASYGELYDLLVKANPDYVQKEETFTGTGSTRTFQVATDYYGTVAIDYKVDATNGIFQPLRRLQGSERNAFSYTGGGPSAAYRFQYNSTTPSRPYVELLPTPSNGDTYRHIYIVAPADLTSASQTVDGVSGWEEYIVIDAAMKCLQKEESSTTHLERQKAAMLSRIEEMAENRTLDQPGHIISSNNFYQDPGSMGRVKRWRF